MNSFILVTDRYDGQKIAIRTRDIVEVTGSVDDNTSRIFYYTPYWKRGRKPCSFSARESIEEVYAMLNGDGCKKKIE